MNSIPLKQFADYEIPDTWRFVPIEAGTKAPIGHEWQNRLYSWQEVPKPGETIKAPFQNRETGEIYYKTVQVGAVGLYYQASGLVGLDYDGESAGSKLVEWGITLPPTITISSGRPGRRLEIYKLPKAYQGRVTSKSFVTKPKAVDEFGREKDEQLEIFVNKQSLVYGMHPDTKKPYRVLHWVDPDKIPDLPLELIYKILVSEQEIKPTTAQNDTELARELLEYIPLGDFCWEQYRDFLFACHSAGLSENEVLEASRKSPKHTDKGFYQIWRYIKGKPGITIATLIHWAKQNGWKPKPKPSTSDPPMEYYEYLQELEKIKAIEDTIRQDWEIAQLSKKVGISQAIIHQHVKIRNKTDNSLKPSRISEILADTSEPLDWLVEGLLPVAETVLLTAAPKVGKTLLSVDLAYAVCTGGKFLDYQSKKGRVLLISADESLNSTRWKLLNRGFTPEMDMWVLTNLNIYQLEGLEKILAEYRPDLVIIDSLKATARDANISENSAEFGNAIYDLKELLTRYRASGILIHHAAKGKDREALEKVRGSSSITGAVWGIWLLTTGTEGLRYLQTFNRDIPGEKFTLKLDDEMGTWERLGDAHVQEGTVRERIIKLLKQWAPRGLEASEIKDYLKLADGTYRTTLARLVAQKIIGKRPNSVDGKRPVYYCIESQQSVSTTSALQAPLQASGVTVDVTVQNAYKTDTPGTCNGCNAIGSVKTVTSVTNLQNNSSTTSEQIPRDKGENKSDNAIPLERGQENRYISTLSALQVPLQDRDVTVDVTVQNTDKTDTPGTCNGCNAPWESENRYNEKASVTPALQEPLPGGTGPNAVYWRKQRYQVQGDINLDGRECYLLDGGLQAPKSECVPAGDFDIFATWNGEIPDWNPTSSPKPWQELRRFSFDIETTGLNPDTDRVIAIAGGGPGIGAFVAADADETKIIRQFMDALRAVNPDILIGYNCYKFDLPFLIKRCELYGIKHPFTISDKPKKLTKAIVAGKPLEVWPIYAKDRQVSVIDLYPLVVAHDNVTAQLENHTLKQAALGFGLRKTPRLELSAAEIHRLWETYLKEGIRDPLEKILLYLNFDVEDTQLLAEFLLPQYYYQKILLPDLSLQQLTLTGTATKWNIVLKNHYRLEPEPDPQVPIEGGLMVVNPGLYRHCAKIDVSSLYPSIMLNYGVWTRKDKDRYGLGVLQYLTRQRLELKRRAKSGDKEAGLMSGAIKIFINSAYGFLGTPGMPFNDYQEFAKVPAYGREILKFMLHYLENNNAVIVEADTDGIIFSHPQPEAIRDSLQKELPDGINIELEWTNTHVYCAKKKSYILFHPDGTIKANGIYKKRDKTKLEKIYPIEYLKRFLEGGLSEAETYHQELEKSLLSGNHPISELSITRSIRANEKALLKLGKPGDTITFYHGNYGATISGDYSPRHYLDKVSEIRDEILSVVRKN